MPAARLTSPGSIHASERTVVDGFVSVCTNTGHDRTAEPVGTFAFNNCTREVDCSFRAVRLTIQTAKEVVGIYYASRQVTPTGEDPRRADAGA